MAVSSQPYYVYCLDKAGAAEKIISITIKFLKYYNCKKEEKR
jgi:hypothetical protein